MKEERKFYKTILTVTILSEDPLDLMGFSNPIQEADYITNEGQGIGYIDHEENEISAEECVKLAYAFGSEPEFFGMDRNGNPLEDF